MGKSSILRNLEQAAPPPGSLMVYADLAGETSFVASTADLLLVLADRVHAALARAYPDAGLEAPEPAAYDTPARAQFRFNRLAEAAHEVLGGGTLILALDEFEALLDGLEEPVHQFLKLHPELLCPTYERFWSKMAFGDRVSDFVFRESYNDYQLVEIEAPIRELFRKDRVGLAFH